MKKLLFGFVLPLTASLVLLLFLGNTQGFCSGPINPCSIDDNPTCSTNGCNDNNANTRGDKCALLNQACTCAGITCPDNDPPTGTFVTCHMLLFLEQNGLVESEVVTDAAELIASDAQDALREKGFTLESQDALKTSYVMGQAGIHLNGQRVIFESAKITLATFATNKTNNAGFIEVITIDKTGKLLGHSLDRVD